MIHAKPCSFALVIGVSLMRKASPKNGPTLTPKNDVDRRPIIWGVTVAAVAFLLLVAMTAWAVAVE